MISGSIWQFIKRRQSNFNCNGPFEKLHQLKYKMTAKVPIRQHNTFVFLDFSAIQAISQEQKT